MNLLTGVNKMNKSKLKKMFISFVPRSVSNILFKNKIKGNKIQITYNNAVLKSTSFIFVGNGVSNSVIFEEGVQLTDCEFFISGNNNKIIIGKDCSLVSTSFWMEESNNVIKIGDKTTVSGKTQFSTIEGTQIIVGEDCMFSSNIIVQTGDSHTILQDGKRINTSSDIVIGNHVWVGTRTTLLKGTTVADNSIVGACALVNNKFLQRGCIVAGVPAKVVKTDIHWERDRI